MNVYVELAEHPKGARHDSLPIGYVLQENGCWEWAGKRNDAGYGMWRNGGRYLRAHRVVWEMYHGTIAAGLELDHLCRNRACVSPFHLEPVTHRVNMLRGETVAARHAAKTHCPQGHEYDAKNTGRYRGQRYCRACCAGRERCRRAARAR